MSVISLRGRPIPPVDDPAAMFWDDLTAANRLKIFLLSSGVEVSAEVIDKLAELTERYRPEPL